MLTLTKDIKRKTPVLYSQEKNPDPQVIFKLFVPWASGTWYITEGSAILEDGTSVPLSDPRADGAQDWTLFGWGGVQEFELGYVSFNELRSVKHRSGLTIERDRWFRPAPLSEVKRTQP